MYMKMYIVGTRLTSRDKMDKEKQVTIITYLIIIGITLVLAYIMSVNKTLNFTIKEFCILDMEKRNFTSPLVGFESSCFHPFDTELPIFECRIKCHYG